MNSYDKNLITVNKSSCKKDWTVDYRYAIQYTKWLLRFLGIWHLVVKRPVKIEKYFSKIIAPLISIALMTLVVPMICHIAIRPLDRVEIIVLLAPLLAVSANLLIHLVLVIRSDILKICVEHMELDWQRIKNSHEHGIMMRQMTFSHKLTLVCIAFMYSGALSYLLLIPLISGNKKNEVNETLRPRPFPGTEIFFDVQANVVYEIVFAINFVTGIFHCTITTAVCNLSVVLVSHACGQIQVIKWNFENFVDEIIKNNHSTDVAMKLIGFTVHKHVRVLNFASRIEEALTEIFLIEIVSSTLVMCFIEYDIILTSGQNITNRAEMFTWIMLLISFSFNLFLYCKFGEVLSEKCAEVSKVAYMIDWYKLPPKTQLAFVMVIKMGNYPCKLTAGGIMELSIASFASITKTSLAYLNMIRTTMG